MALARQLETILQQLENERRESARFRELIESHRSEIFITKKEVEKISKEVRDAA